MPIMPERSKKRKNKNKRKNNKNNVIGVNKNNVSESTNNRIEESTSSCVEEISNDNLCAEIKEETTILATTSEIISTCIQSDEKCLFVKEEEKNDVISSTNELCCDLKQTNEDDATKISKQSDNLNNEDDISSLSETYDASNEICTNEILKLSEETKEVNENNSDNSELCTSSSHWNNISEEVTEKDKETINNIAASQDCNVSNEKNDDSSETKEHVEEVIHEITASSQQILENVNIQTAVEMTEVPQPYIVEIPGQSTKVKCKLNNGMKSKSCDDDDSPTIVEITDESGIDNNKDQNLAIIDSSNVIISGEDSDVEWENVGHFNLPHAEIIKGVLSSDTIPLNIVHCEQTSSLSPEDEKSLRNYLQTLNLSSPVSNLNSDDIKMEIEQIINREVKYRLRKKGMTEDNIFCRPSTSRSLAVIDEEGSGDSSKTSRRHSYLSDKKSDNEELEDEVFERKQTKASETKTSNRTTNSLNTSSRRLIPQPCIRVDAKLKEPEVTEARGDWSMKTIEKMTGAELVYLTDSSSSTSSIYDANDDIDKGEETDVSVRMITPTIEVTDTAALLSNTFLSKSNDKSIDTPPEISHKIECYDETSLSQNNERTDQNIDVIDSNLLRNSHEIVILSTDHITTNLTVKDVNEPDDKLESFIQNEIDQENKYYATSTKPTKSPKDIDNYDLEIKVLKCELNDAINNLIKEVISDSENTPEPTKSVFTRQDSSSSVDSSQCTAKYNPTYSSLNDVSNVIHDGVDDSSNKENFQVNADSSHVKDVLQSVTPSILNKLEIVCDDCKQPSKLRDICVEKITSFPFGDKILEELAHVSERLQNMSLLASERKRLEKKQISSNKAEDSSDNLKTDKTNDYEKSPNKDNPPPIAPRKSSLKINHEEQRTITPKTEIVYECLSPSQKMLMEKTNTYIQKDFKIQPRLDTSFTEQSSSSDKNWNKWNKDTPKTIAPMKSETGSRLLALLRDTSISNNLNHENSDNKPLYHVAKDQPTYSETFSKRLLNEIDSTKHFEEIKTEKKFISSTFKPIPPPKPKKLCSYFYESDESSNYRSESLRSMQNSKKSFHYSTGNLSKEIENDISSIQNMHRYCTNIRDRNSELGPRRPSLPKDLCDQQMEYIRQKEKEVDAEIRRLEQENKTNMFMNRKSGPRPPMLLDDEKNNYQMSDSRTRNSIKKYFSSSHLPPKPLENNKLSSLFSSSQEELLREKMYTEYRSQMAEREQRKQQKIIKVTRTPGCSSTISRSMPLLDDFDSKLNNPIEHEFISKARERWCKLGIRDPETEDERDGENSVYREPKVIEHKVKVIEAGEEKDVQKLPSHMQEFVKFTVSDKDQRTGSPGESDTEKTPAHVVVFCAVVILVLTIGKIFLRLFRNK